MSQQDQTLLRMGNTTAPASESSKNSTPPAGSSPPEKKEGEGTKVAETESLIGGDKPAAESASAKTDTVDDKKTESTTPAPIELKLPEGFDADTAAVDGFKKLASESGLDSAKAQKFFDHFVGLEQARTKAAEESFVKQDADWMAEVKADKELGGANLPNTIADIRRAETFIGKEAALLIRSAGLGNHPVLVRALAKLGRAQREDTVAGAKSDAPPTAKPKSDDDVFFPPTAPPQGK